MEGWALEGRADQSQGSEASEDQNEVWKTIQGSLGWQAADKQLQLSSKQLVEESKRLGRLLYESDEEKKRIVELLVGEISELNFRLDEVEKEREEFKALSESLMIVTSVDSSRKSILVFRLTLLAN